MDIDLKNPADLHRLKIGPVPDLDKRPYVQLQHLRDAGAVDVHVEQADPLPGKGQRDRQVGGHGALALTPPLPDSTRTLWRMPLKRRLLERLLVEGNSSADGSCGAASAPRPCDGALGRNSVRAASRRKTSRIAACSALAAGGAQCSDSEGKPPNADRMSACSICTDSPERHADSQFSSHAAGGCGGAAAGGRSIRRGKSVRRRPAPSTPSCPRRGR